MLVVDHAEIVHQANRVPGVRLAAAILRAVGAHQVTERRRSGGSALPADARNSHTTRETHRKRAGIYAWNRRRKAIDSGLVHVHPNLGFIDDGGLEDLLERIHDILGDGGDILESPGNIQRRLQVALIAVVARVHRELVVYAVIQAKTAEVFVNAGVERRLGDIEIEIGSRQGPDRVPGHQRLNRGHGPRTRREAGNTADYVYAGALPQVFLR